MEEVAKEIQQNEIRYKMSGHLSRSFFFLWKKIWFSEKNVIYLYRITKRKTLWLI